MGLTAFVSGQLDEVDEVRRVFHALDATGVRITHDWCVVGPRNHASIVYHHPLVRHYETVGDCIDDLGDLTAGA